MEAINNMRSLLIPTSSLLIFFLFGCAQLHREPKITSVKLSESSSEDKILSLRKKIDDLSKYYASSPSTPESIGKAIIVDCNTQIEEIVNFQTEKLKQDLTSKGLTQNLSENLIKFSENIRKETEKNVYLLSINKVVSLRANNKVESTKR